jgi:8-oxo-dGTP diphosphatase
MPSTAPESSRLHVAVGVILDAVGRVLISRRAPQAHQGDLWEFPGGKVEQGEDVVAALARELREELDITVRESVPLLTIAHDYDDRLVFLDVHVVHRFDSAPRAMENQPLQWVSAARLADYAFPAANVPIIDAVLAYLEDTG